MKKIGKLDCIPAKDNKSQEQIFKVDLDVLADFFEIGMDEMI